MEANWNPSMFLYKPDNPSNLANRGRLRAMLGVKRYEQTSSVTILEAKRAIALVHLHSILALLLEELHHPVCSKCWNRVKPADVADSFKLLCSNRYSTKQVMKCRPL